MRTEMTELSEKFFNAAQSDILTVKDAVRYLEKEARIRTLREKLERFSHGCDLRKVLVQGLLEHDSQRKKDAVERRVRGWLSDKNRISSIKKQDAIEICFILKLSLEEADRLVAMISEEALHYRNPDEIVSVFALQHGMSYKEARELNEQMKEVLSPAQETRKPMKDAFTPLIRTEVMALQTKEELADYLEQAACRLGRYHNNAYEIFMDRMSRLEKAPVDKWLESAGLAKDETLSVRAVLREYLYEKNVLYAREMQRTGKKDFVFTKVQQQVSASWPDETTLSRMKSRKADVTRKVLILLFLATDQGMEPDEDLGGYVTRDEAFEDLYIRLNDMLSLCGFSELDPRSPFDWLILYCICVDDMWEVDDRMKGIFKEMFGERKESENGNEFQDSGRGDDMIPKGTP